MRLPAFDFLEPRSLPEACAILAANQADACLLSGGTDLLVLMKQRVVTPKRLVNLKAIPGLSYIEYDARDGLRIGPLTTLSSVAGSEIVKKRFGILSEAAARVASPLIRNNATIGGNVALDSKCWYLNQSAQWRKSFAPCYKRGGDVCHVVKGGKYCFAVFCPDTVPALMALGAQLKIISVRGTRMLPVDAFCTGKGEKPNVLEPDEIISEISVPEPPGRSGAAFIKLAVRGSIDYALVDVAVALTRAADDGRCRDAKVVISAIGPGPVNATRAAGRLTGREPGEQDFEAAGAAAVDEARRVSSVWTSVQYRRRAIKTLVIRAARQAWNNI
ncbi:MAG: FAD binding domain-containing protein [Desulfobacterales bacterium]|nr:FAD binding domain-containing protein [Desulfobacterales bacterium]